MPMVSIGAFARLARLSPKALRLYDELGLLPPARVDPYSGYRWYELAQVDHARLVAALRQLGVPLARITEILGLEPAAAAEHVARYWAAEEVSHAARRELAGYLVDRLNGKRSVMYEVETRHIPARKVLCLLRHVDGQPGLFALGKEMVAKFRDRPVPRVDGIAGASFVIYYGQVNEDSDGPVEWCRPVPDDQAEAIAGQFPELTLRTEPAHEEAFVHLGTGEIPPAQWPVITDSLQAWGAQRHRQPSDLGMRVTLLARPPITADSRPDVDFAVPLR